MVFEGSQHVSLRSLPGMQERSIRIGSAGKTFSFTAWKVNVWLPAFSCYARLAIKLTFICKHALLLSAFHSLLHRTEYSARVHAGSISSTQVDHDRSQSILKHVWQTSIICDVAYLQCSLLLYKMCLMHSMQCTDSVDCVQIGWVTGPLPLINAIAKAHQFLVFTVPSNLQRAVAYGLDNESSFFTWVPPYTQWRTRLIQNPGCMLHVWLLALTASIAFINCFH